MQLESKWLLGLPVWNVIALVLCYVDNLLSLDRKPAWSTGRHIVPLLMFDGDAIFIRGLHAISE